MRSILIGDCRARLRELEADSIQCVVTSPPYWGLRRYDGEQEAVWGGKADCEHEWMARRYYREQSTGKHSREAFTPAGEANSERLKEARWREDLVCARCGAWHGAFGLEPTPDLYVEHTVDILREIRRALRSDGVVWWNLGDTYLGSWGNYGARNGKQRTRRRERYPREAWDTFTHRPPMAGSHRTLKPKDLCLIPARVALRLQTDGWWVRSMVVWSKPNVMPESVKDRPTDSHEYILLLTKSKRYFYDADAVREPHLEASLRRVQQPWAKTSKWDENESYRGHSWMREERGMEQACHPGGRNLRSVWHFATVSYPGAHFAVFPPELPRRCILAGSPPKVCSECGSPWQRETRPNADHSRDPGGPGTWRPGCQCCGEPEIVTVPCADCAGSGKELAYPEDGPNTAQRNGEPWQQNNPHLARLEKSPTGDPCTECGGSGEQSARHWPEDVLAQWPTRPPIVLDPFAGSGTTLMVAEQLGRWWIGIDICEQYLKQMRERTDQRSLTAAFENVTG